MFNKNIVAVTNRHLCKIDFLTKIEELAKSDVEAIILREKDLSEIEYEELAKKVIEICEKNGKKLILHNFLNVAKKLNHKNIHLPFEIFKKLAINENSRFLDTKLEMTEIGTSIHSVEDAIFAEKNGATYITAGHIFETDCKKGLKGRGLDFLKEVCSSVKISVYAIGGISSTNLESVLDCGAKFGCIMSGAMK